MNRTKNQVSRLIINLLRSAPEALLLRLLPPPLRRPAARRLRDRALARAAPLQRELADLIAAHGAGRPVIVFPPSLDWEGQLFQRPQQLALALARQGALVFYQLFPGSGQREPFRFIHDRLALCAAPMEAFARLERPLLYLLTWNARFRREFSEPRVIYDYVDDLSTFEGDPTYLQQEHQDLLAEAGLVLATAERLHREVLPARPDALLLPNGADYDHFAPASRRAEPPPAELAPLVAAGTPIVGYAGALAGWFDYGLLAEVAGLRTDLAFVLIGPDHDGSLPPVLRARPNLHYLGVKPYRDLPGYLAWFDAAIIPFRLSPITHATSPVKLFEYMAAGKPPVVTPMQESLRYPGVLAAATPDEWSQALDEALRRSKDPEAVRLLQAAARQNTWDARAQQILQALPR